MKKIFYGEADTAVALFQILSNHQHSIHCWYKLQWSTFISSDSLV